MAPRALDLVDDPDELARLATEIEGADPSYLEARLEVPHIHCAACTAMIEQALSPFTETVQANAATRSVRVRWDPTKTCLAALLKHLKDIGYPARLHSRDAAATHEKREQRRALWQLFVSSFCMMQVMMYALPRYLANLDELPPDLLQLMRWAEWMLTVPVICFSATPFFQAARQSLRIGRVSMDVPVAMGISIAFVASTVATFRAEGEVWNDSLTMFVTFLLLGRWLEAALREKARASLERLFSRLPEVVERRASTGNLLEKVPIAQLRPGDEIRVAAGQTFPADGVILTGTSQVDESLLTGESLPISKTAGDVVIAGSLNLDGLLWVCVDKTGGATRFGQIAQLVQRAADEKPPLAQLADRWAQAFLIGVLLAAGCAGIFWLFYEPSKALSVVIAVLIVTCPCALSLAMPTVTLAATTRLAASGVLLRSAQVIESVTTLDLFVFDKTGTLSDGALQLARLELRSDAAGLTGDQCLGIAAAIGDGSIHPVSAALIRAAKDREVALPKVRSTTEHPGRGISAQVQIDDQPRDAFLGRRGTGTWPVPPATTQTVACAGPQASLTIDGQTIARFFLHESLRPDATQTLQALANEGIAIALISGDGSQAVKRLTDSMPISHSLSDATPENKYRWVRQAQRTGHHVAVIGDGINDAPMLARADVSIALGTAAPLAQLRADVVLLADRLSDLVLLRQIAQRAMCIIKQNLAWAATYNALCVPLALAGAMPPWLAGLGMAGSSLLVTLNAQRILYFKPRP